MAQMQAKAKGYTHTNAKGVTYNLNMKMVTLRGQAKARPIYYFSRDVRPENVGLPEGYEVVENARNGFLTIRKIR